MDRLTKNETLFHIEWGDGDHTFVLAPNETMAIEKMSDGKDMIRYVVKLDGLYQMIFKAGQDDQLAKLPKLSDE